MTMTEHRIIVLFRMGTAYMFGIALTMVLAGCGPSTPDGKASKRESPGKEKETWEYWDKFNNIFATGRGFEVLHQTSWDTNLDSAEARAVLTDIFTEEKSRTAQLSMLPVLNVAPEVTSFVAKYAQARGELVGICEDVLALQDKAEQVTSLQDMGFGMLSHLSEAKDDPDFGILGPLLVKSASETTKNVLALRPESEALERKAQSVRDDLLRLNTAQISLRAMLSQRFNREFPSSEAYLSKAREKNRQARLSDATLMQGLIGRSIRDDVDKWTFDSMKEFVSFEVLKVNRKSDLVTDYDVQAHVKGIRSGTEHDFRLRLTYASLYTRSKLLQVEELK